MSGRPVFYEVAVPFLELVDPNGYRHFLKRGADLPDWVSDEARADLVKRDVLNIFEVI